MITKKALIAIISSAVVGVAGTIGVCATLYISNQNKNVQGENGQKTEEVISFSNMKVDTNKTSLTDEQKTILNYFDNDYFYINDYQDLQRYPNVYKGAQINFVATVKEVIKSNDEEFEVLAHFDSTRGYEKIKEDEDKLFVLKGKQTNKRIIKGDNLEINGRYLNIDTYNIEGKEEILPTISVFNFFVASSQEERKFNLNTITKVANYIFGENAKVKEPICGEDFNLDDFHIPEDFFYLVTLDDKSKPDFKSFEFSRDYGRIVDSNLSKNHIRLLFVGADFEHYITTTRSKNNTKIEYYDKELKRIWTRDFNEKDIVAMDYTKNQIILVENQKMHVIDINTGEDEITPVSVGNKVAVYMVEEGAILIGTESTDTIMKVNSKGETKWKIDLDSKMENIDSAMAQMIDNNIVVNLTGTSKDYQSMYERYIVVSNDGTKLIETK